MPLNSMPSTQKFRLFTRSTFFLLYLLAPVFDLLRYDLNSQTFYFFGQHINIGLEAFYEDHISSVEMLLNFAGMIFIPVISLIIVGALITYKWGLLYCGWLCPHESVVEIINNLMRQSSGKYSLWDRKKLPEQQLDGTSCIPNKNKRHTNHAWYK